MFQDLDAVARNIRQESTEGLLDRYTVYRHEMEAVALDLIQHELNRRGVTESEIDEHSEKREFDLIRRADGSVQRCELCDRPAVVYRIGWHRIWQLLPIFPRYVAYCRSHQRGNRQTQQLEAD